MKASEVESDFDPEDQICKNILELYGLFFHKFDTSLFEVFVIL